jgi:hypothetical protein
MCSPYLLIAALGFATAINAIIGLITYNATLALERKQENLYTNDLRNLDRLSDIGDELDDLHIALASLEMDFDAMFGDPLEDDAFTPDQVVS